MPRYERRVVITGLGLITPLGIGADAVWGRLAEGRGGIDHIKAFPVAGLGTDAGGEVQGFNEKTMKSLSLPRLAKTVGKSSKYMARDIQFSVAAAQLAMTDAGLTEGGVDPTRIGLDLGAGLISTELDELAEAFNHAFQADDSFSFEVYGKESIPKITPIWLLKYLPNMLACHISILLDCQGPSNSITEAEAASNLAISEAARIIQRGRADVMITGGADSKIHPMSLIRTRMFNELTRWEGDPVAAHRPFDSKRSGWVPGEGAGIVIIEEREHALKRGAKIYGEILGFGSGCDANPGGGLDPNGKGTELAIRAALRDAELSPDRIGHVHAHGIGTPAGDLAEARAISRVFGENGVPVTSAKGHMGNIFSGCGAVELLISLIAANKGLIPPTLNCDEPDPACTVDVVTGSPREAKSPIFVNTNFSRHGQAATVVVEAGNAGA